MAVWRELLFGEGASSVLAAAASRFFVGPLAGRLLGGGFGDDRNAPASASARSLSRRPTARAPPTQPSCAPRAHSRPQSALRLRVAFNSEPLEERRVAGPLGEEIKASTPLPQGPPLVLFGVDPAHSSGPHEHRIQHLDGDLGAAARPIVADVIGATPAKSLYVPAIRDFPDQHLDGVADAHVGLHDVKVQAIDDSFLLLKEPLMVLVKLPFAVTPQTICLLDSSPRSLPSSVVLSRGLMPATESAHEHTMRIFPAPKSPDDGIVIIVGSADSADFDADTP